MCDVFLHDNAVLSISVDPKQSHVFVTACESGEVSLYDLRLSNSEPIILASSTQRVMRIDRYSMINTSGGAYHSCCFNPVDSNLLAVGNEVSGIELLDLRMHSTPLLRYRSKRSNNDERSSSSSRTTTGKNNKSSSSGSEYDFCQNVMCVEFNSTGTRLAALRYKLRPVIYETNDCEPKFLFDHLGYKNACTMKRCCFAGLHDEFLVSGKNLTSFNETYCLENISFILFNIYCKPMSLELIFYLRFGNYFEWIKYKNSFKNICSVRITIVNTMKFNYNHISLLK